MLIYRLISLWFVLAVGKTLFLVVWTRAGSLAASAPIACRADVTAGQLGDVMRQRLGLGFAVRPQTAAAKSARGAHQSVRPDTVEVALRSSRLLCAEVTIVRRPDETLLSVIAGGVRPLRGLTSWMLVAKRVRSVLASAARCRYSAPAEPGGPMIPQVRPPA